MFEDSRVSINAQIDEYYSELIADYDTVEKNLCKNPFPGLRPFKYYESPVFFGREKSADELMLRLLQHHFLAVIGASGTGKSSLIRAGLFPNLEFLPGRHGSWKVAICRPGINPFSNLAAALHAAQINPASTVEDILHQISLTSYGLKEFCAASTEPCNVLVVIDQFEEIFRYNSQNGIKGRNETALFVKMITDIGTQSSAEQGAEEGIVAAPAPESNIYVLITMRSEFLGDCVQFPGLVEAINKSQYLVPKLSSKRLRKAIMGPMDFVKASVDESFVNRLIDEVGDNAEQLPLLQHALKKTFEAAKTDEDGNKILTYDDFVTAGKISDALNNHAQKLYDGLPAEEKIYCKILFQCITDRATDNRGIRRPLKFRTILRICEEYAQQGKLPTERVREALTAVINKFRADDSNILMPPPEVTQLQNNTIIDISHESIMRVWKKLEIPKFAPASLREVDATFKTDTDGNTPSPAEISWVLEEASDAGLLRELLTRGQQNELLSDAKIEVYSEWLQRKKPGITWAYLYKPFDVRTKNFPLLFRNAIELIEKSKKARRRKKIVQRSLIGIVVTTFIAVIIAVSFARIQLAEIAQVTAQNKIAQVTAQNKIDSTLAQNKLAQAEAQNKLAQARAQNKLDSVEAQNKLAQAEAQNRIAQTQAQNKLAQAEAQIQIAHAAAQKKVADVEAQIQIAHAADTAKRKSDVAYNTFNQTQILLDIATRYSYSFPLAARRSIALLLYKNYLSSHTTSAVVPATIISQLVAVLGNHSMQLPGVTKNNSYKKIDAIFPWSNGYVYSLPFIGLTNGSTPMLAEASLIRSWPDNSGNMVAVLKDKTATVQHRTLSIYSSAGLLRNITLQNGQDVTSAVLVPERNLIFYATSNPTQICVGEINNSIANPIPIFTGANDEQLYLAINAGVLYYASSKGTFTVWNYPNSKSAPYPMRRPTAIVAGKKFIYIGCETGELRQFDIKAANLNRVLIDNAKRITAISVSPDEKYLVVGFFDGTIELIDNQANGTSGPLLQQSNGYDITAAIFSAGSDSVIAADSHGIIYRFPINTGKIVAAIKAAGYMKNEDSLKTYFPGVDFTPIEK